MALFEGYERRIAQISSFLAANGIASLDDAYRFIELGATRLGTSRIVKLVKNEEATGY